MKLQTATVHSAHCTFQAHFLQPKPNSNPTWPTFHLHLLAQTKAQGNGPNQGPRQWPFLFLSFPFFPPAHLLQLPSPLSLLLSHHFPLFLTFFHHPTYENLPIASLFSLSLFPAQPATNQPACLHLPTTTLPLATAHAHILSPLKPLNPNTLSFPYKTPKKRETKGWFFGEQKRGEG